MTVPEPSRPKPHLSPNERSARSVYCPRCAKFVVTDLSHCPDCPPSAEARSGGPCPRCESGLAEVVLDGATGGRCSDCGGTWIDRGDVFLAMDLSTEAGRKVPTLAEVRAAIPPQPAKEPTGKRHLPCPRCGQPMVRRMAAPLSGVLADLCPRDGLWFGGNDYERFAAFVAAGGIELSRREVERGAIDAKQAKESAGRDAVPSARRVRRGWLGKLGLP